MNDESIHKLSQSIRDIVSSPLTEHLFLKSSYDSHQIVTCLDTIEDAQLAVDEYRLLDRSQFLTHKGKVYLVVYGVLQGIFLQQDALRDLANALHFPFRIDDYQELKTIREIRNQIVGHPTKYSRDKTESLYRINRISLSLEKFDVLEYNKLVGQRQIASVNITRTLYDNEALVVKAMRDLVSKMEADIGKHKSEFRDKPLADCFHPSLGYMCEKLWAGALASSSESDRHVAFASLKTIEDMLCDLCKALSERGKRPKDWSGVDLIWDELKYPMTALRAFYLNESTEIQPPQPEAARIFAWFVESQLSQLRGICLEIDDFYRGNETT